MNVIYFIQQSDTNYELHIINIRSTTGTRKYILTVHIILVIDNGLLRDLFDFLVHRQSCSISSYLNALCGNSMINSSLSCYFLRPKQVAKHSYSTIYFMTEIKLNIGFIGWCRLLSIIHILWDRSAAINLQPCPKQRRTAYFSKSRYLMQWLCPVVEKSPYG